jgi:hypothetical protein
MNVSMVEPTRATFDARGKAAVWFSKLAAAAGRAGVSEDVANAEAKTMVPLLAEDFSSWAFCSQSLHAVAEKVGRNQWCYAEIKKALSGWCNDNRPLTPINRLSDARVERLGELDRCWLAYYRRRWPEVEAEERRIRVGGWTDPAQLPCARLKSLVRSRSPAAWEIISSDEATGE